MGRDAVLAIHAVPATILVRGGLVFAVPSATESDRAGQCGFSHAARCDRVGDIRRSPDAVRVGHIDIPCDRRQC